MIWRPSIYRWPLDVVLTHLAPWFAGRPGMDPEEARYVRLDVGLRREFWLPGSIDLELGVERSGSSPVNVGVKGEVRRLSSGALFLTVKRLGAAEDFFGSVEPLLRGFVADLVDLSSVDLGMDNRILLNDWQGFEHIRWPRVVPDEVYDAIAAFPAPEATLSEHHRTSNLPMQDFGEMGRRRNELDHLIEQLNLPNVRFQTTSDPDAPHRIWWQDAVGGRCVTSGEHTEHGTWPELFAAFAKRALLVRASDMEDWEHENVVRGEWVLPSQEEVELYRMLGESIPPLWNDEALKRWLVELRAASLES